MQGNTTIGQTAILRLLRWWHPLLSILLLGATGCGHPLAPEYYGFQNVQVSRDPGGQTLLSTTLKLYNPNSYDLHLKHAEVDISVNGNHAGHSQLDTTILIPRKDTFFIPVALQLDMKSILRNALQLMQDSRVNVALDGRVKVKKGAMTFNRPFHYESKEDLKELMPNGMGF